ncbi:MAG TPA: glycosyltransferase family 9 protein [Chitinophagaceae bacterium]|jgi:ADP-heptose:LPS heptosyltransferase
MNFSTKYLYRSAGIGDVLWTEPILKELAKTNKKVVLFTQFKELFNNYPLTNVRVRNIPPGWKRSLLKLMNLLSNRQTYHKLDGIYEARPKMHILHAYQQYFSLPVKDEYPVLYLDTEEKKPIEGLPKDYVVLHLDANVPLNYRKIYGVDWNEVVSYLRSKNLPVVLTGNYHEPLRDAILFKGSIRQLIQLISNCRFFIGVDSGPSHIAASLHKPSLIFFGSVNPEFRHFPGLFKGYFLQQPCEYAGCYHEVISGRGQPCRLVGDEGIPKCSVHTTEYVTRYIDLLMEKRWRVK